MPAPTVLTTATALRRRRAVLAAGASTVTAGWLVVMSVVVVAMGGAPPPADVTGGFGIPPVALDAYQRAATTPLGTDCGLRWQILAGVARIESNHAVGRTIGPDGHVDPAIIGPTLDGSAGAARITDTDTGRLDGDSTWDHAVGPLQFLPSSWQRFGDDGNHDGNADPHNIYDAALVAAAHLCPDDGATLDDDRVLHVALYAYNRSDQYVADVLAWIDYYDQTTPTGTIGVAAPTGAIVNVRGIHVDQSIAPIVDALLNAAHADGLALGGSGYRTHQKQIALRRAHCGTSNYAIYDMPPNRCTPPTARPGQSLHEIGLAIDFTCAGVLIRTGDPCFTWLTANAAHYGLSNLASEPWHWSVGGR